MNRLKIVQKYMSIKYKIKDLKKYKRAQKLSKKIIQKSNDKITKLYS